MEDKKPVNRKRWLLTVLSAGLVILAVTIAAFFLVRTKAKPDLLAALLKLREQLEWPGLDVATAAKTLGTMENAVDFVKNGILYVPYRGMWGGATGTLRTRTGNTTDKSVLLTALLKELDYEVRMVWSRDFPRLAKPYVGEDIHRAFSAVEEVRSALEIPEGPAPGGPTTEQRETVLGEMRAEIDAAGKLIAELIEKHAIDFRLDLPATSGLDAVGPLWENYWMWAQVRGPGEDKWVNLDTVFPDLDRPTVSYPYAPNPITLQIDLAMVDSAGRTESIVGWSGPVEQALGHEVSLAFLPAKATLSMLEKITDPAQVPLWTAALQIGPICQRGGAFTPDGLVLHMRNGEVRTGAGTATRADDGFVKIKAVPIKAMSVRSVDSRDYPRVKVELAVETQEQPYWHHGHFRVRPADQPEKPLPVRIESVCAQRRPVVLVIDVSFSMFDDYKGEEHKRIELARAALKNLIDLLPADQPVSLVSFAGTAVTHLEPTPLGQAKEKLLGIIDQKLTQRSMTRIPEGILAGLEASDEPAYVILLTDGQDNRKGDWLDGDDYQREVVKVKQALQSSRHRFIPIGIGEADDELLSSLARTSGTAYRRVNRPEDLLSIYGAIGREISGRAVISFAAPPVAAAHGQRRKVTIELEGYPGRAEATYRIPSPSEERGPARHLRLAITTIGGDYGYPTRTYSRVIQDLSEGVKGWELMATHRIGLAVAPVPSRVVLARFVDEMIDLVHLSHMGAGGPKPRVFSSQRGMSYQIASITNSTLDGLGLLTPETAKLRWRGPTVLVESARMVERQEGFARRRQLDFLHHSYGPNRTATRQERIGWGLALAAVEGRLLGTDSVNQRLLARVGTLEVVRRPADWPAKAEPGQDIIRKVLAEDGFLVRSPQAAGCAWAISPSGQLRAVLYGTHQAKGASVEEVAEEYKRIRKTLQVLGALAGGVVSASGSQNGALLAALCNFWDEEMKLWCFSSVMLGLMQEGIEQGRFDAEKAKARAKELCELEGNLDQFWQNLFIAFATGWAGGKAENWLGNFADPTSALGKFGFSAGAGYFNPIPRGGADFMIHVRNQIRSTALSETGG